MFAAAAAEAEGMPPFQNAGGDCNDDKAVQRPGKEKAGKSIVLILMIPGMTMQAFKQIGSVLSVTIDRNLKEKITLRGPS